MAVNKLNNKPTASVSKELRGEMNFSKICVTAEKGVAFIWLDEIESDYEHSSGLILTRDLSKQKNRWGVVVKTHAGVTDVKVGEYILPEKTNAPFGAVYNGIEVWRCSIDDILLVTDDKNDTISGD